LTFAVRQNEVVFPQKLLITGLFNYKKRLSSAITYTMLTNQCIAIGAIVLICAVSCFAQTTVPPIVKCYICSPCSTVDGYPITECQPAQRYCYKEVRSDGSMTRSCAVNCTAGTWTLNNVQYSVNCCNDKDGCNSATGFSASSFGIAASFLAAIAAFEALRRH
jgi:hypothetical protein